jgi:DNA-binding MarR family transcriptional regulator
LIDRLEKIGWVQRKADDKDGRANRLHLTARGRKKIDALLPQHNEVILKLFGGVPTTQVKSLQAVLEQVERTTLAEN